MHHCQYLSAAACLSCRSLATTAVKKRKITQRIMSLAVEHQFVTPLTAMLVESEDAKERLLADSPKDPKHGCCIGTRQTIHSLSADVMVKLDFLKVVGFLTLIYRPL